MLLNYGKKRKEEERKEKNRKETRKERRKKSNSLKPIRYSR